MHSGNSFELWYNFGKMYRENRYILTGTFRYILVSVLVPTGVPFQKHKNVTKIIPKQVSKNGKNSESPHIGPSHTRRRVYDGRRVYDSELFCQNAKSHLSRLLSVLGRF